jgi:hypothetical protein
MPLWYYQCFGVQVARGTHHQKWSNDPVEQDTEAYLDPQLLRPESLVQGLVFDFTQDWVHHDKQADCCIQNRMSADESLQKCRIYCVPIGIDTPTNLPFCSAGPVLGTKFPRRIPIIIASRIHSASKRSSQPKALKAEDCSFSGTG